MPKDMETSRSSLRTSPATWTATPTLTATPTTSAFGLNYSGQISDDRTKKYGVDPLTKPETEV
jgi:beta-glucosidase